MGSATRAAAGPERRPSGVHTVPPEPVDVDVVDQVAERLTPTWPGRAGCRSRARSQPRLPDWPRRDSIALQRRKGGPDDGLRCAADRRDVATTGNPSTSLAWVVAERGEGGAAKCPAFSCPGLAPRAPLLNSSTYSSSHSARVEVLIDSGRTTGTGERHSSKAKGGWGARRQAMLSLTGSMCPAFSCPRPVRNAKSGGAATTATASFKYASARWIRALDGIPTSSRRSRLSEVPPIAGPARIDR